MFHEHRALKQIKPARAKQSVKIEDIKQKFGWSEQKIDGERFLIHTNKPAGKFHNAVTSRTKSVVTGRMVEKTDRVPHLTTRTDLPPDAIFDDEFVSSGDIILRELPGRLWDKLMDKEHPHMQWLLKKYGGALPCYPHVSNTASIMGSLADEAIRKQEERGWIWAYCFDVLQLKNTPTTHYDMNTRRYLITKILEKVDPESGLVLMPRWDLDVDGINELFGIITQATPTGDRGEGLIIKAPGLIYNSAHAWYKVKKDFVADVVLTGNYEMGREGVTGKMLGLVGALEIGVYHEGTLYPVGWVSAIMDSEANLPNLTLDAMEGKLAGRVMEAAFNKFQDCSDNPLNISLQHPRYSRWRDDKSAEDCTLEALLELRHAKS